MLYSLLCVAATGAFSSVAFAQDGTLANVVTGCDNTESRMAVQMPFALSPAVGPYSQSKSAAILGGAPSKLDQMRMAQVTGEISVSHSNPPPGIAELEAPERTACARTVAPFAAMPAQISDIPENAILGTMSVSINHSPFDNDWAAVNRKPAARAIQAGLNSSGALNSGDRLAQIAAVNAWVNRKIRYAEDRQIYGQSDYWASARETLRRGAGDCEDFAIAKLEMLAAMGIDKSQMRLVVARDLVRNADHAVLVVMLPKGAVMLDNMTDRLLDARLPNDYRPIMSFSQNSKWIHGYAVQPAAPARMALAAPSKATDMPMTVTLEEPVAELLAIAMLIAPSMLPTLL